MEGSWRVGRGMTPPILPSVQPTRRGREDQKDFSSYLTEEMKRLEPLTFSRHAEMRLRERGITLTPNMLSRLEEGVMKAGAKGATETLIIVDHLLFVVSVKNRTVITAMEKDEAKENLFTQIDSAVLM